jgi:two-component system, OmpR family, KDP operon response regulator KdpE
MMLDRPCSLHDTSSMSSDVVLVIEDDAQIRRVVRHAVEDGIGSVREAATAREGLDIATAERPQLIVLDLGLPDGDGVAVCREIRSWSSVPILVLSARNSPQEKAGLLDAGADDYVTKPFSTIELQARLRAALRRGRLASTSSDNTAMQLGLVTIDFAKPSARRDGDMLHLTKTEWQLLRALARHAGRTLTHRQIYAEVWGSAHGNPQEHLRVHIRSLRRKLEADPVRPRFILTEPGVGYRLEHSV